jgi:hypothetical protein
MYLNRARASTWINECKKHNEDKSLNAMFENLQHLHTKLYCLNAWFNYPHTLLAQVVKNNCNILFLEQLTKSKKNNCLTFNQFYFQHLDFDCSDTKLLCVKKVVNVCLFLSI